MKILHLNTYDANGGAAIAARRLHYALNEQVQNSSLLGVGYKTLENIDVSLLQKNRNYFSKLLSLGNGCVLKIIKEQSVFYSYPYIPTYISQEIKKIQPDIIHLHWISDNFLSFSDLCNIAALNIPIVWTLHDTWAFTGGCHIKTSCDAWKRACSHCPILKVQGKYDLSYWQWKNKQKVYNQLKPNIVVPSQDFFLRTRVSPLLSPYSAKIIPNCCNTNTFKPFSQHTARQLLGLEEGKKYILFGAVAANYDKNKGFDLLEKALRTLPNKENTECLIFGASHAGKNTELPLPTRFLGKLHDEISLALVYAAADVFVCPSREESFSLTTLESIACGTPVAAFSVGGIPDMIEHGVNGMLATPHNPEELAQGIAHILENKERRESMGKAARKIAEERYSMPVVAKQYIALYEQLISKHTQ